MFDDILGDNKGELDTKTTWTIEDEKEYLESLVGHTSSFSDFSDPDDIWNVGYV